MVSGDDDLDAGWDDESEASATGKPAGAVRPGAATSTPEPARFNPDRATLPPPMPEQEYIEKILATDQEAAPPRRRMNTLIEHDPLQYDSPDAHERQTRPPASAAASMDDGFLDLQLDDELARRSSPAPEPAIPPPPPAPSMLMPLRSSSPSEPDPLDELPIDAVLDSLAPGSLRPPPPAGGRPRPAPPSIPSKPRRPYDSTPSIEVVEISGRPAAQMQRDASTSSSRVDAPAASRTALGMQTAPPEAKAPPGTPAATPPSSAKTAPPPSSGAAARKPPQELSKTPLRVAAVKAAADAERAATAPARPPPATTPPQGTRRATPPSGTRAITPPPRRPSEPQQRRPSEGLVERPTRAIRTPAQVVAVGQESASEKALLKVAERFEAGDFGRALMLAEQVIELDEGAEELRHYAEVCREKLRQTYLDRIGTGRTILRVSVTDAKLRERALDPRLAFLLSLLDGASSIDDVVDMSTMPPLEAVRALHELFVEGVIEVVERLRKAP